MRTEQFSGRDAFEAGQQLAVLCEGADALICATDHVAMGALNALHAAEISVPQEIAVTGFDGIASAGQFIPATTIRQPIEQIVREAFSAVIFPGKPKEISLPGNLICRATV